MLENLTPPEGEGTFILDATERGTGIAFITEAKTRGGKFGPSSTEKDEGLTLGADVAAWGENNDWPQQVVAELEKSDLLLPLITTKAKRMMGQGLVYGTTTIDEKGEERMKVMRHMEIDRWLKRTNVNMFVYKSWIEWLTHGNVFPELQMDFDGKIAGLYVQDACRSRFNTKDKQGRITKCILSGKWAAGGSTPDDALPIDALDPDYDVAGQITKSNKGRFILPIRLLVHDRDYYGRAPWHGLIVGRYLELAQVIIASKLAMVKNITHFRYLVEIGSEFWELAYPGWNDKTKYTPEQKRKIKGDLTQSFTKWVTNMESQGRTMLADMVIDEIAHDKAREYRSLWKITPFKLKIPTGAYVEDSAEVDAKIIRAFMDASLFGATPSKDRNSSGSGSDKRIAHTHDLLDNQADSNLLLEPLDVMAEVNGWHEKYGGGQLIKFWFKSYHSATLDQSQGVVTDKPQKPAPPKA